MVKENYGITDLSLLACDPWSGAVPQLATRQMLPGRHVDFEGSLASGNPTVTSKTWEGSEEPK